MIINMVVLVEKMINVVEKMVEKLIMLKRVTNYKNQPPWAVPQLWRRTWNPKNVNNRAKVVGTARRPDRSRGLSCGRGVDCRLLLQLAAQLLRFGCPPAWGRR